MADAIYRRLVSKIENIVYNDLASNFFSLEEETGGGANIENEIKALINDPALNAYFIHTNTKSEVIDIIEKGSALKSPLAKQSLITDWRGIMTFTPTVMHKPSKNLIGRVFVNIKDEHLVHFIKLIPTFITSQNNEYLNSINLLTDGNIGISYRVIINFNHSNINYVKQTVSWIKEKMSEEVNKSLSSQLNVEEMEKEIFYDKYPVGAFYLSRGFSYLESIVDYLRYPERVLSKLEDEAVEFMSQKEIELRNTIKELKKRKWIEQRIYKTY